jgi:hypothetical protein
MNANLLMRSSAEVPVLEPAEEETLVEADEHSALGLVEVLLKAPTRADELARDEARQVEVMPRFLSIALVSYTAFALALVLVLNAAPAWPSALLAVPAARWQDGTVLAPVLAYTLGLIAASGICLPSFYFFGLLAGVKLSWLQTLGIVLRCKAASAVTLLGILPIYLTVGLGMIIFGAGVTAMEPWLYLGLVLPFLAGLQGVYAIYHGVMGLAN